MKETSSFISRDETNIVKGVAIILMFIHHVFTFPSFWIESTAEMYKETHFAVFCNSFKICVPIFAFLTGYFYFFAKNKTYKYSIKKSTDLWVSYLFVFIGFVIVECVLGVYDFSLPRFVTELFALTGRTMTHGWYVVFYIGTMLLMPLYHKLSEKSDFLSFSIFAVGPLLCSYLLKLLPIYQSLPFINDFIKCFYYLPVVASGYFFSKYKILDKLFKLLSCRVIVLRLFVYLLMIVIPFLLRSLTDSYDFIFAPLFVFGTVSIAKEVRNKAFFLPISFLGKYSLLIWFLHCAFANQLKEFTQPVLYYPQNPILVTVWGLIMCLSVAVVIKFPIDAVNKLKNKIFNL